MAFKRVSAHTPFSTLWGILKQYVAFIHYLEILIYFWLKKCSCFSKDYLDDYHREDPCVDQVLDPVADGVDGVEPALVVRVNVPKNEIKKFHD